MEHGCYLLLEYIVLPALFILVPRLNQFILDRLGGQRALFFEPSWHWKIELTIALFLSYILLLFRLSTENIILSSVSTVWALLIEIGFLIAYYVGRSSQSPKNSRNLNLTCLLFGLILLGTIVYYRIPINSDYLFDLFKQHDQSTSKWTLMITTVLTIAYTFFYVLRSFKIAQGNRIKSGDAYHDMQQPNLDLQDIINKFKEYEKIYDMNSNEALHVTMQKVTFLKKNGYTHSAMAEINKLKLSRVFLTSPQQQREAIIKFEIDLLLGANETLVARERLEELPDSPVKTLYRKKLEKILPTS